jgi:predicted peptidase
LKNRGLFFGLIVLLITCSSDTDKKLDIAAGQHAYTFEKKITRTVNAHYLLYLPKEYGVQDRKWPLIYYLHGGMGRGDDLERLKWYPLVKMAEQNDSLPFIILTPQCPMGATWTDTELLIALLDEILSNYAVDPDRVYLTGYSMGGSGVWYLAYEYPDRFAAIAPMAGIGNKFWASRLKDMPIWVFHGAQDTTIAVLETIDMVRALKSKGGHIEVTIDPERGHRPPSVAEHEELFDWFLEHRRNGVKKL